MESSLHPRKDLQLAGYSAHSAPPPRVGMLTTCTSHGLDGIGRGQTTTAVCSNQNAPLPRLSVASTWQVAPHLQDLISDRGKGRLGGDQTEFALGQISVLDKQTDRPPHAAALPGKSCPSRPCPPSTSSQPGYFNLNPPHGRPEDATDASVTGASLPPPPLGPVLLTTSVFPSRRD